jgi:cob(I)alamin adenosyltransferase
MLIINTGNGKGKTTAAMGQILRALGHGWKVGVIQLFKGKEFYGEQNVFKKFKNIDWYSYAPKHPFCIPVKNKKVLINVGKECQKALLKLEKLISLKKSYDMIVLDEFNIALKDGFIKLNELLELLNAYASKTTIIITGRCAPKALIDAADLVTEMKEIKHPYNIGIKAEEGIEY